MITVEKPNIFKCPYGNYRCTKTACTNNRSHVPQESFLASENVPGNCVLVQDMTLDESIDITVREWMKKVFFDHEDVPIPPEFFEFAERKLGKPIKPFCA